MLSRLYSGACCKVDWVVAVKFTTGVILNLSWKSCHNVTWCLSNTPPPPPAPLQNMPFHQGKNAMLFLSQRMTFEVFKTLYVFHI